MNCFMSFVTLTLLPTINFLFSFIWREASGSSFSHSKDDDAYDDDNGDDDDDNDGVDDSDYVGIIFIVIFHQEKLPCYPNLKKKCYTLISKAFSLKMY